MYLLDYYYIIPILRNNILAIAFPPSFLIRLTQLDNAINGQVVNIHDCQFFKCEYEDGDEEDEDWGDLPGEKASEVIPEMMEMILNSASEYIYIIYRILAATCIQRVIRGAFCRTRNKDIIAELMIKIEELRKIKLLLHHQRKKRRRRKKVKEVKKARKGKVKKVVDLEVVLKALQRKHDQRAHRKKHDLKLNKNFLSKKKN